VGFQIVCDSSLFCLLSLWLAEMGIFFLVIEESQSKESK